MKAKQLSLAIAVLLVVGGLWLSWSAWRTHTSHKSSVGVALKTMQSPKSAANSAASSAASVPGSNNAQNPGPTFGSRPPLAPPIPNRRFTDFTPEQRVQFARQGHGPGG